MSDTLTARPTFQVGDWVKRFDPKAKHSPGQILRFGQDYQGRQRARVRWHQAYGFHRTNESWIQLNALVPADRPAWLGPTREAE